MNTGKAYFEAAVLYAQELSSAFQGADHTAALFKIAILIGVVLLAFGVLIGHSLTEQAGEQRSRRQAAMQRELNEQWRALEVSREANRLFQESRRQANDQ